MPIATELNVDTSATAMDMANAMFGNGISITSASFTGAGAASGTYTGGLSTLGSLTQSDTGVILSTGNVTGDDTITGFQAPTPLGGGAFTPQDQIDVSGLTDAGGNPVNVFDVTITDTNGDGTFEILVGDDTGHLYCIQL